MAATDGGGQLGGGEKHFAASAGGVGTRLKVGESSGDFFGATILGQRGMQLVEGTDEHSGVALCLVGREFGVGPAKD